MNCPILKGVGSGIRDAIMRVHVEDMQRDECIQDECEFFEECWAEEERV